MAETDQDPRNYAVRPPGRMFVAGWIVAVAIALVTTAGLVLARDLWIGRQASELEQEAQAGPRVLVAHVTHAPSKREIELPAEIHGYIETPVYAKVAGYLKTIKVDKGDRVKQGQVLAILESPEIDQQVKNAQANYELARVTDERNRHLKGEGVVSQQSADEAHAAMLQAKALLEQASANQAYEVLKAPFDGLVTARYADPGMLIPESTTPSSGAKPVVAMATLTPLRVYADVPQSFAPFVNNGDQASMTVAEYPQREFMGTITRHPKALDDTSRTMLVEVDLENADSSLYPGMYAKLKFTVSVPASAPMVPDDALVFQNGKVYVPVVRGRRLYLVPVSLGYDDGQFVEVTRGLSDDDLVALNVGQSARDGESVQPVMERAGR